MFHSKMTRSVVTLVALATAASVAPLAAQSKADSAAARAAAKHFVAQVDNGAYTATWQTASAQLKAAVDSAGWAKALETARGNFDPLTARTEAHFSFVSDPPNSPPGEYALVGYHAKAKGGANVTERVVLVHVSGKWLVAGYFIQPGLL